MSEGTLLETCYDHVKGEDSFTMTAAERWSIAMVKRLKKRFPDDVEIRHTNPDGSMVVRMPFDWMRVIPKRKDTLTDTEREKRSEAMMDLNSRRAVQGATAPNSGE